MQDALVQAYARLTVHEFAIEVMMANWLASMSKEDADQFLLEYARRSKSVWVRDDQVAGDPAADQIVRDSIDLTENLIEKVRHRVDDIREKQARAGMSQ